jgi:hypothetical protein
LDGHGLEITKRHRTVKFSKDGKFIKKRAGQPRRHSVTCTIRAISR